MVNGPQSRRGAVVADGAFEADTHHLELRYPKCDPVILRAGTKFFKKLDWELNRPSPFLLSCTGSPHGPSHPCLRGKQCSEAKRFQLFTLDFGFSNRRWSICGFHCCRISTPRGELAQCNHRHPVVVPLVQRPIITTVACTVSVSPSSEPWCVGVVVHFS